MGAYGEEVIGDAADSAVEGAGKGAFSGAQALFRDGADQVGDCFRLSQRELSV